MSTNKKPGQSVGAEAGSHINSVCSFDNNTEASHTHNDVGAEVKTRENRLQFNYDYLIWFIAELIHVASDERRFHLLGECSLNLPDDALHDIKLVLRHMRASEQMMKVAA